MRFAYVSCCENGLFGLRLLMDAGFRPDYVVTIGPELGEKYQISGYVDFRPFCEAARLPLVSLKTYSFTPADLPQQAAWADLLIVNGWNRLIPKEVIEKFEKGALGIHAGHPPIGLGRAPLPWNLIKGHQHLEVYVFQLTERADDGDILAYSAMEITHVDTVKTLYEKVMLRGAELFLSVLGDLRLGKWNPIKQNMAFVEHYPKRTPEDGRIDFRNTREQIYNFIRAQTKPYPGAYFELAGRRFTAWSAIPFDSHYDLTRVRHPGKIMFHLPSGPVVQTGSTAIWLTHVCDANGVDFTQDEQLFKPGQILE